MSRMVAGVTCMVPGCDHTMDSQVDVDKSLQDKISLLQIHKPAYAHGHQDELLHVAVQLSELGAGRHGIAG